MFPEEGCKSCPGLLFSNDIPSGDKTGTPEITSASSKAKRENPYEPKVFPKARSSNPVALGRLGRQEKKTSRMGKVQLII